VHREGRAAVSFCILDKRILCRVLLDYNFLLLLLRDSGNHCGCLQFFSSEERRRTLQIGVSIGLHGRRAPAPIVLLSVLDGITFMAVRHHSVRFVDFVAMQLQLQYHHEHMLQKAARPASPTARLCRYFHLHHRHNSLSMLAN
jgi:hypothetical protein